MPKPKKGARLGGSASHQRKILANLAAQLFEHKAITTTDAKAKLLRPYAEKLITKAKSGTLADRRNVLALVPNKPVVNYLFDQLAESFAGREGGYTRIIKLENRKGDNAPMSQISLVMEEVASSSSAQDSRAARAAASKKAADEKAADEKVAVEDAEEAKADEAKPAEAAESADESAAEK